MAAEALAGTAWVQELARLELRAQALPYVGPSPAAPLLTAEEEELLREGRARFDALTDEEREAVADVYAAARAAEGRRLGEAMAKLPRRDPLRDAADLLRFVRMRGLGLSLLPAEREREQEALAWLTAEEREQYAQALKAAEERRLRLLRRLQSLAAERREAERRGEVRLLLRRPVRRHDGRRAPRRSVRSSPRLARAPGRESGEDSEPERVGARRRTSSARAAA